MGHGRPRLARQARPQLEAHSEAFAISPQWRRPSFSLPLQPHTLGLPPKVGLPQYMSVSSPPEK